MPRSVTILEYPQKDLGCTITIEEELSPNPGTLGTPEIFWDAGKTPTLAELNEANARAVSIPYAVAYSRREAAYQRLKAEFGAYNGGRVAAGECTAAEMGAFLDSAEAQSVFQSLRALNFAGAITKINAMTETLATQAFKDHWAAKVGAEL